MCVCVCVCVCETFLTDRNASFYEIPGYNFAYRNRQKGNFGDVAMYISDGYTLKFIIDPIPCNTESDTQWSRCEPCDSTSS